MSKRADSYCPPRERCWNCGYNLRVPGAEGVCPECGTPRSISLRDAPLTYSASKGAFIACLLFLLPLCLSSAFIVPVVASPDGGGDVAWTHPVVWGPPAALGLAGLMMIVVVASTWPPRVLGLRVFWIAASAGGLATSAASLGFFAVGVTSPASASSGLVAMLFGGLLIIALLSFAATSLTMTWTARRLGDAKQAGRWRSSAMLLLAASIAATVAIIFVAADQNARARGEGIWVTAALAASVLVVAAIVSSTANTARFLRQVTKCAPHRTDAGNVTAGS